MTPTSAPLIAIIRDAAEFIDAMFAPGGVADLAPAHPAAKQVEALQRIAETGTVDRATEAVLLAEVADCFLDFRFWPRAADDRFWSFLEDDSARRRIEQTIRDPAQYEDTLAEVDAWASLRQHRLAAVVI